MIAHVDWDGNVDPSSGIQINPEDVETEVPELVWDGLQRRWWATQNGECACGGDLVLSNRKLRREWTKAGLEAWDAMVYHNFRCTAVEQQTRTWVYRNRRLAR